MAINEKHKVPILLATMENTSPLKGTIDALKMKDSDDLTWAAISADLIEECKRLKTSNYEIRRPS